MHLESADTQKLYSIIFNYFRAVQKLFLTIGQRQEVSEHMVQIVNLNLKIQMVLEHYLDFYHIYILRLLKTRKQSFQWTI